MNQFISVLVILACLLGLLAVLGAVLLLVL